jgi:protein-tyrosine phosphatase
MFLTEMPFGLPGRIFRSPMPFSPYDPWGHALHIFQQHEISLIVLLAERDEYYYVTGQDLPALYLQAGFQVLHLPIPDGGIPSRDELAALITAISQHAQAGRHVVIHCYAGVGRTGLVLAAMAKRLMGLSGDAAIAWVRRSIARAVETPVQRALLLDDGP